MSYETQYPNAIHTCQWIYPKFQNSFMFHLLWLSTYAVWVAIDMFPPTMCSHDHYLMIRQTILLPIEQPKQLPVINTTQSRKYLADIPPQSNIHLHISKCAIYNLALNKWLTREGYKSQWLTLSSYQQYVFIICDVIPLMIVNNPHCCQSSFCEENKQAIKR